MRYFIIIISIIYLIPMNAQTYEGKIGKYPIFMEIDMDYTDNRATAFYFYKSHLQNIPLQGTSNDSELILTKKFSVKEELFTLTINKDKISGTWQNNGQTLIVHLTISTEDLVQYKLNNLNFVRDSITTIDNKELVWFTEKHSTKKLFRLGNGFTQLEREFMNPILDSIHTENTIVALDCDWADIEIELELLSNQYISYTEYSSIYCGGAHPSHNTTGYNFDLKNSVQLHKLTDIYPNVNHYQLLKRKYKDNADLDSECEYFTDDQERFKYYSWVLTKDGITITPQYPHVMTPCETGFPLTYKELQNTH